MSMISYILEENRMDDLGIFLDQELQTCSYTQCKEVLRNHVMLNIGKLMKFL